MAEGMSPRPRASCLVVANSERLGSRATLPELLAIGGQQVPRTGFRRVWGSRTLSSRLTSILFLHPPRGWLRWCWFFYRAFVSPSCVFQCGNSRTEANERTRKGPKRTAVGKKLPTRSPIRSSRSAIDLASDRARTTHPLFCLPRRRNQPVPPKICTAAGAKKARCNEKKAITHGRGHVKSTFMSPGER